MTINIEDVALAMEDNRNYAEFFVNRDDGKVIRITRDVLEAVEDDDAESLSESSQMEIACSESVIFNPKTPLIQVPAVPFSERVKLMNTFVQQMANEKVRAALSSVMQSRNPSMRFNTVMAEHSDEQKKWLELKKSFYTGEAQKWVATLA
jgi:hypothetical protein